MTNQSANSIVINASLTGLSGTYSGLYVYPIRSITYGLSGYSGATGLTYYGITGATAFIGITGTNILTYSTITNEITNPNNLILDGYSELYNLTNTTSNGAIVYSDQTSQISSNALLDYSQFGTNFIQKSGINANSIAMSSTGQYQTITSTTGIYYSLNYGTTFTLSNISSSSFNVSISASGQYQIARSSSNIYFSTNYGKTWINVLTATAGSCNISASGQYSIVGSTISIYLSNNYGQSWKTLLITNKQYNAISASGQFITCCGNGQPVLISNNYGETFTQSLGSNNYTFLSMSASGQYQTITLLSGTNVYISSNYGKDWTLTYVNATATAVNYIAISASGQYQILGGTSCAFYSINYGQSWNNTGFSTGGAINVSISSNAQYIACVTATTEYYLSVTPYAPYLYATMGGTGITSNPLVYNTTTKQITYSTAAKTFIIDHPTDFNSLLVHACIEGPEVGVYYRGTGKITNNIMTTVTLPDYAVKIATDFTVQLSGSEFYTATEVIGNSFNVYGKNGIVYWCVYGKRNSLTIEPNKDNCKVYGSGPYKYIYE